MPEALGTLWEWLNRDPAIYRVSATCEGRLARHGMFPNISAEPQDVLPYAKALR